MTIEERLELIVKAVSGMKRYEWGRVEQQVNMLFSSKAAKVELDDLSELKRNLEVEFNLRRFGEIQD